MLWALMYLIIVAAWMGNCVCERMEDRTMIDVIGIFILCLFWPIFLIGIFILCLFWPIFLIGVMLSDFCKGAKK